jgi:hypothetical protein
VGGDLSDYTEGSKVEIPVLPRGRVLTLTVLSTWGDPHYAGMAGIEIFDQRGQLVRLADPVSQASDLGCVCGPWGPWERTWWCIQGLRLQRRTDTVGIVTRLYGRPVA